ncbi:MAG: 2,3-diaminopropionate biosynthesis protein SbnA [Actinomycetota bacterium]
MIHDSIVDCIGRTPLVALRRQFPPPGPPVIAKLEMLNPGGSMKDRSARLIIEQGLHEGTITCRTHLLESTSGNFGIALAMTARVHGLSLTCVVDPLITSTNLRILRSLGARIEMVAEPDFHGSYLASRISRVAALSVSIPESVWINQYANQLCWRAHYDSTGAEILEDLDCPIGCLVVPVSTTGTILGLSRRLRCAFPGLRVVAVDAVGSVIFGGPSAPRKIPGLGASRVPELLSSDEIDEVICVSDREAAASCRELAASEGVLAGGSSGAVVAAITKLRHRSPPATGILTILPDRGDRYLDLVYDDDWVDALPAGHPPLEIPRALAPLNLQ